MNLVNFGIFQEKSDYRCHVCFVDNGVYVYKTKDGVDACRSGKFKTKPAYQTGVSEPTAEGYLVPPDQIRNCRRVEIPDDIKENAHCLQTDNTTDKGRKGVAVVRQMLLRGMIPLELSNTEITDIDLQISGLDIVVNCNAKLQVKTDYKGGALGSGNLFLQIKESNPLRRH